VNLTVTDEMGNTDFDRMTVTVKDITSPVLGTYADLSIKEDVVTILSADVYDPKNGTITDYLWEVSDSVGVQNTYDTPQSEHAFNIPGTYTVKLVVTDSSGNTAETSFAVTVSDATRPVGKAINVFGDVGDPITFDASASRDNMGITKYTWTFVDGGQPITLDGETPTHTFKNDGKVLVTLTVEDSIGNKDTITVMAEIGGEEGSSKEDESFLAKNQTPIVIIIAILIVVIMIVLGYLFLFRRVKDEGISVEAQARARIDIADDFDEDEDEEEEKDEFQEIDDEEDEGLSPIDAFEEELDERLGLLEDDSFDFGEEQGIMDTDIFTDETLQEIMYDADHDDGSSLSADGRQQIVEYECDECGGLITDEDTFCPHCGVEFE